MPQIATTGYGRVFAIPNSAGPENPYIYEGYWKSDGVSWKQGDIKPIRFPSPRQLDAFITAGSVRGEPGLPQMKITSKFLFDLSKMLQLVKQGCPIDIQVHLGNCGSPTDFTRGWNKIGVLENAVATDYTLNNMTALDPKERAEIMETLPWDGTDYYEIGRMIFAQENKAATTNEVVDIAVCDSVSCGACGLSSDGCSYLFALALSHAGSPGLSSAVMFSTNGGSTWTSRSDIGLPANKNGAALACIGINLVVASSEDGSITYAPIADIQSSSDVWTRVSTGVVVGGEPTCIFSFGPTQTWFGGKGGYLYFTTDPTAGLSVQDPGSQTVQDINAIHGWDADNIVAVGASNAVVYTSNGGQTWSSRTGPSVGNALRAVFMRTQYEWWVGDVIGKLWYTRDQGATWHQKAFPKQGGRINDIKFVTPTVGYMAGDDGAVGRVWRTIDGGYDWYVAPEGTAPFPACRGIDKLAVCSDVNTVFGAGLATGGAYGTTGGGIIVKGAGAYL